MKNKIYAIFKKDLSLAISYRFGFIFQFISIFGQLVVFYFLSKFIEFRNFGNVNNIDYFSFVLIGLALMDIGSRIVSAPSREFSSMKSSGVLEEVLQLNINNYTFGMAMTIYPIFISLIRLIIYLFVLAFVSEYFIFSLDRLLIAIPAIVLFISSLIWVSLIASAYSFVFFTTNFVVSIFISFSIIFGCIYYDYQILPSILHFLSNLTPFKPTLEILRWSFIDADLDNSILNSYIILLIQNLFFLLVSIISFDKALKHAKKNGTLLFY